MSSDHIDIPKAAKRPSLSTLRTAGMIGAIAALSIVAYGITTRVKDKTTLERWTNEQTIPSVATLTPQAPSKQQELMLPGTLQAFNSAPIYARVNGYLKQWNVDIGATVKAGQVLAEIETPDLDQQLQAAQANLATAKANEQLAQITAKRWQKLLGTDSVSQQEADEKNGDYAAKQTIVAAAQAEVARLRALQAFKQVVSPFDGVVTERKTDIGALINAGHDAGHELFVVSDIHRLRLYVGVPQSYATQVRPGMQATLEVPEHPGQKFAAHLVSVANAVSENSGTELVELAVDNPNGALLAGEYANVRFAIAPQGSTLQVPASSLAIRKGVMSVGVVSTTNHVTFHPIEIARDLGTTVEVSAGISAQDHIIDNPPESMEDGDLVRIESLPAASSTGKAS